MTDATDAKLVDDSHDLVDWILTHDHNECGEMPCGALRISNLALRYAHEQVQKEREACARIADHYDVDLDDGGNFASDIAHEIRQRGGGKK